MCLQSCSSAYRLDSAQHSLRQSFAQRNYQESAKLLEKFASNDTYKSKDKVLLNLEKGMVYHFSGSYDSSNVFFSRAEQEIDNLFTKSISRGLSSILVNDNKLAYDGEDYEDIYLNVFKALNYVHEQKFEDALVETRRIAHKLSQLSIKYNGLAKTLAKADTTGKADWQAGKTNIQYSALGNYLSAVLYAKSYHPDDARIAFENLRKAFQEQRGLLADSSEMEQLHRITKPDTYNILLTGFAGRAPIKQEHNFRLLLNNPTLYIKFSIPTLRLYPSQVNNLQIVVDDSLYKRIPLIEKMDEVAREVYKVKEPIIYARALLRSFLKAAGTRFISDKAEDKSRFLGGLAQVLGIVGQEVSEKADLRSWQTMPGKAYAGVLQLSPGLHKITFNYYSYNGNLLFSDQKQVKVSKYEQLLSLESLYWN